MRSDWVPITDLATLVRSKNAGPFVISLDLVFPDAATYSAVRDSHAVTRESIADLYALPLGRVSEVIEYPAANAIKVNILREQPAGSFGERDIYGSQHGGLLERLQVPMPQPKEVW
jgi:Domain of unknown function (DUF4387)